MKQKLPWLLLGVGLFVGFVLGAIVSTFFLNQIAAKVLTGGALLDGGRAYHLLHDIRLGMTNEVIERVEGDLDVSIISASATLEHRPSDKEAASLRKLLQRIAQYRRQYPRTNESPDFQEALDAALKSAEPESGAKPEKK